MYAIRSYYAYGGSDGQVSIIDISDPNHLRQLSSMQNLDGETMELKTESGEIILQSSEPFELVDDERLYKYAWFVGDGGKAYPYYMCEDRVEFSEDRRSVRLLTQARSRITSYNVCYTKLLRLDRRSRSRSRHHQVCGR